MGKFKFALETILKVNKLKKKQVELEFTHAQKYLDQQYKILLNMHKEINLIAADMANMVLEGTSIHKIKMYADYTQTLRNHIKHQEQIVKRAEKQVEDIKTRLISLMREINVLSELRDKQYRDYIIELEKKHQKIIDEFTSFKVYRQGGLLHG